MQAFRKLSIPKSSRLLCSFAIQNPTDIPSCTYYDERINKAGREGDFTTIHQLLNKRANEGFFNTNNTFKFISTSESSTLDDLLDTIANLDHGFARKSSYDSLIARLAKTHRVSDALRVVDSMLRRSHGPNAVTFHPIINALTKKGEFDEAWRVIELMRSCNVVPDLTAYNFLLTGYCFKGDLASAAKVLTKMEEEEVGADTRTYDALVLGACRAGKLDAALAIARRMVEDGVSPLYCTHSHIINAMLKFRCYEQAVEFVRMYAGRDLKLDSENFGILASKLIVLDRLEEAKVLVKEMSERRLAMGPKLKDFYALNVSF